MINLRKFIKYLKVSNKVARLCAYDGKHYYVGTDNAMAKFETNNATLLGAIVEIFGKLPDAGKTLYRGVHKEISDVTESTTTWGLPRTCDPEWHKEPLQHTGLVQSSGSGKDYPVDIYAEKDRYVFLNIKLTDLLLDKTAGCSCTDRSRVLFSGEDSSICMAVSKLLYTNNYLKDLKIKEGNKNGN